MQSILATAGRAKMYNTDGTGRDSYVSMNSGGFNKMYEPASAMRGGSVGPLHAQVSAQHIARGGGQGSPGKKVHYQVNGTGRDSYIHCNHGGFASNYTYQNDRDAYVNSLRGYPTTVQNEQRILRDTAKKNQSPQKDHFVTGQISIRSPKARNGLNMLKAFQYSQAERLAMPRKRSVERFADLEQKQMGMTSGSKFLRSSKQFGSTFDRHRQQSTQQQNGIKQYLNSSFKGTNFTPGRQRPNHSISQMMKPGRDEPMKAPLNTSNILGQIEDDVYQDPQIEATKDLLQRQMNKMPSGARSRDYGVAM